MLLASLSTRSIGGGIVKIASRGCAAGRLFGANLIVPLVNAQACLRMAWLCLDPLPCSYSAVPKVLMC